MTINDSMLRRSRSLAVLLAASLLGAVLAANFVQRPPRPPVYRNFDEPAMFAGKETRWARPHARLKIPERGLRPLHLTFSLRAPASAPARGAAVLVLLDGVPARWVQTASRWTEVTLELTRPAATPGVVWVELDSELFGPDQQGVGVADVSARPPLSAWPAPLVIAGGFLAGVALWLLVPLSRPERARIASAWRAAAPAGSVVRATLLGVPLCTLATLVPLVRGGDATSAANALFLAGSFLSLALLGRWLAIVWERLVGPAAFPVYRSPVFELLVGLSSGALLLYAASFALKRLFGRHEPLPGLFAWLLLGALVVACLLAVRTARGSRPGPVTRPILWAPADYLTIALFLGTCVWLARPELGALFAFSSDPEHHIFWANQIASSGYVPDVYRGTDLWIAYPLGFHALAITLMGVTPLYASTAVNVLPVLGSTAFVFLMLETALALASGSRTKPPASPLAIGSRALLFVALAAAFDAARFGAWESLEGTGRLAAGLLHALPVVVVGAALARMAGDEGGRRPTFSSLGFTAVALALSIVLVFELNPTHVPPQLLLSALAVACLAWATVRQRLTDPGDRPREPARALAVVFAGGVLLAGAVLLADPFSFRALGQATGWWTVADAHIVRANAEFHGALTGRTCLTWSCIVRAVDPPALASAFGQPLAALGTGPLQALESFGAAPEDSSSAFPNLLGKGYAPVHGWIASGLVIVPLAVLLTWVVHPLEYRLAVVTALLACGLDSALRAWLARLIHPFDPQLRLLPEYAVRAANIISTQTVWPLLIAGPWAALGRLESRRRWWGRLVRLALIAGLVAAAVTAAGDLEVRASRLPRHDVSRQDLLDLWALERDQMRGTAAYFVSSYEHLLNGERWLFSDDPSTLLYVQSSRPSLFLYGLSAGARYTASGSARVCAELADGSRYPRELVENDARWMAILAPTAEAVDEEAGQRRFCGRPLAELFPDYVRAGRRGRVALYRLW